jgi:hypothetical protein
MSSWQCTVLNCTTSVPLDPEALNLQAHLLLNHGASLALNAPCPCAGCKCDKGGECASRVEHPWHGDELIKHIIRTHYNFKDVCLQCGNGHFANVSSLNRHQSSCPGRIRARCRGCWTEFHSITALGGHLELNLCPAQGNGQHS